MANDHQNFDCQECGAHFHSREELDRHNRQQHADAPRTTPADRAAQHNNPQNPSASNIDNRDIQR